MNRNGFEIIRKEQQDLDDLYHEYYSEIDINSRPQSPVNSGPSPFKSNNTKIQPDARFHSTAQRHQTSVKRRVKEVFNRLRTQVKKSFLKDSTAKTMSNSSFSSMPVMNTNTRVESNAGHRRVLSVKPLPTIPLATAAGKPRDLHRRRPTTGPRELPIDLQKVEDQKSRVGAVAAVEKQMRLELDGLVSLLSLYATGADQRIETAVNTKLVNIEDQIDLLKVIEKLTKSTISSILNNNLHFQPKEDDDKTQVLTRSSSSQSLEKLKSMAQGMLSRSKPLAASPQANGLGKAPFASPQA